MKIKTVKELDDIVQANTYYMSQTTIKDSIVILFIVSILLFVMDFNWASMLDSHTKEIKELKDKIEKLENKKL
jgi:hypothetical protein